MVTDFPIPLQSLDSITVKSDGHKGSCKENPTTLPSNDLQTVSKMYYMNVCLIIATSHPMPSVGTNATAAYLCGYGSSPIQCVRSQIILHEITHVVLQPCLYCNSTMECKDALISAHTACPFPDQMRKRQREMSRRT
jgi:hypothetical protein